MREFVLRCVLLSGCALPLAAQDSAGARLCLHWLESGEKPAGIGHDRMLAEAVRSGDGDALALAAATAAEDLQRQSAARGRAVELLMATLQQAAFASYPEATQQRVARALAHATTDPDLEPHRRGYAIAATAQLQGRPERLDWLLQGQVQLRTLLQPKLAKARPDPAQVPGMLSYFARLGQDGLPALPLLLDLLEQEAVAPSARTTLIMTLATLAEVGDAKVGAQVFVAFVGKLELAKQRTPELLIEHLRKLVVRQPELLAQRIAAEAVPSLCDKVAAHLRGATALTDTDAHLLDMLRLLRAALDELGDNELRQQVAAQTRQVMRGMLQHDVEAVRTVAKSWLGQ